MRSTIPRLSFTSSVPSLHIVYRELYFIPIILAALWGGKKGGLITSIAVSLIYIPHVFFWLNPILPLTAI